MRAETETERRERDGDREERERRDRKFRERASEQTSERERQREKWKGETLYQDQGLGAGSREGFKAGGNEAMAWTVTGKYVFTRVQVLDAHKHYDGKTRLSPVVPKETLAPRIQRACRATPSSFALDSVPFGTMAALG